MAFIGSDSSFFLSVTRQKNSNSQDKSQLEAASFAKSGVKKSEGLGNMTIRHQPQRPLKV